MSFYSHILSMLKKQDSIKNTDSILIVAGGNYDRQMMLDSQFTNVTISNLEYHAGHKEYEPYEWKRLDAENLENVDDNTYDWVMIHAGLHHLAIPARGVCEMFRVARKGILCIEARDSTLMKFLVKLGLTIEYELEPVFLSGGLYGGYRNSAIPNYIYRWTEREFEKVVNSFAPTHKHTFFYHYGFYFPHQRFAMFRNPIYRFAEEILSRLTKAAEILIPKQGNQFAFGVLKNTVRQPWLTDDNKFQEDFLSRKYDKKKYKR